MLPLGSIVWTFSHLGCREPWVIALTDYPQYKLRRFGGTQTVWVCVKDVYHPESQCVKAQIEECKRRIRSIKILVPTKGNAGSIAHLPPQVLQLRELQDTLKFLICEKEELEKKEKKDPQRTSPSPKNERMADMPRKKSTTKKSDTKKTSKPKKSSAKKSTIEENDDDDLGLDDEDEEGEDETEFSEDDLDDLDPEIDEDALTGEGGGDMADVIALCQAGFENLEKKTVDGLVQLGKAVNKLSKDITLLQHFLKEAGVGSGESEEEEEPVEEKPKKKSSKKKASKKKEPEPEPEEEEEEEDDLGLDDEDFEDEEEELFDEERINWLRDKIKKVPGGTPIAKWAAAVASKWDEEQFTTENIEECCKEQGWVTSKGEIKPKSKIK